MTIKPGYYVIEVYQGATYDMTFAWTDENNSSINLTGYTARMQVREGIDSSSTLLSLTDASGITLGGTAGTFRIQISATDTAALTKSGVYDVELVSGAGVVTRIMYGEFLLFKEVTR